jgi:hypothetical protein
VPRGDGLRGRQSAQARHRDVAHDEVGARRLDGAHQGQTVTDYLDDVMLGSQQRLQCSAMPALSSASTTRARVIELSFAVARGSCPWTTR